MKTFNRLAKQIGEYVSLSESGGEHARGNDYPLKEGTDLMVVGFHEYRESDHYGAVLDGEYYPPSEARLDAGYVVRVYNAATGAPETLELQTNDVDANHDLREVRWLDERANARYVHQLARRTGAHEVIVEVLRRERRRVLRSSKKYIKRDEREFRRRMKAEELAEANVVRIGGA